MHTIEKPILLKKLRHGFGRSLGILGIALSFMGAVAAQTQHTVRLPQPTGPYQIGITSFALVDEARPEVFTDEPNDKREILVRVWYPAQPGAGTSPDPFWGKDTKEIGGRLAEYMRMPKTTFDDLALVRSHSFADTPLAKSKSRYPVLIFSHGYIPGFLAQNTAQMEELASHGYVVFSIGHSYETVANIFPDGRAVPFSPARFAAFAQGAGKANPLVAKYAAADSAEREALLKQILVAWPMLEESLRVWAGDVGFLITELEKVKSDKIKNMFAGKLDLKRIGVFGMSFGGATAGQVCVVDKRCKAGINLDGLQSGDLLGRPMERPFMFMQSQDAGNINRLFFDRAKGDAYYVVVKGTKHFNYSDFSLLSPDYKKAGLLGTIDGVRMEKIMNTYVLAFFDKYLKGKESALLSKSSADYPEIEFHSRAGQKAGKY